VKLENKDKNV